MTSFSFTVWLYINAGGNDDEEKKGSNDDVFSEIEKMEELFHDYDRSFQLISSQRKKVMEQLQILKKFKKENLKPVDKPVNSLDEKPTIKPEETQTSSKKIMTVKELHESSKKRKIISKTVLSKEHCVENLKNLYTIWKSGDKEKLQAECKKINDNHHLSPTDHPVYLESIKSAEVDMNAQDVLRQAFPTIYEEGALAIDVRDDGNCCYNSVSFMLFGTEERATEIRLFTAVYLILHEEEVQNVMNNNLSKWGRLINDPMWSEIGRTLEIGAWSNALTIENIARACNISIYSMYPHLYIDGKRKTERTVSQRLTGFHGSDPSNKKTVNILWTGTGHVANRDWHINHLVPIIFPQPVKSPMKTISITSTRPVVKKKHEPSQQPNAINPQKSEPQKVAIKSHKVEEPVDRNTKPGETQSFLKIEEKPDTERSDDALPTDSDDEVGDSLVNFAYYKFIKVVNCMFRRIKKRGARPKPPRGPKANKRFVIQNTRNQKITDGLLDKIRRYPDDTGPKENVNSYYPYYEEKENGDIVSLGDRVKRHSDGIYYDKYKVPLESQPKEDKVFKVKFTYHTTYKMVDKTTFLLVNGKKQIHSQRRTTEIFQAPERYSELLGNCFVEFKGDNPIPRRHGNAIHLDRKFIAVPTETREAAIEFGREHKPEEIMAQNQFFDPNNLLDSLRDMKGAEYARAAGLKAKNPEMTRGTNEANWFLEIHNALRKNPFVEAVIDRPSAFQSPVVIMGRYLNNYNIYCILSQVIHSTCCGGKH